MTYFFQCNGKESCKNTDVDERYCEEEMFVCNNEEYVSTVLFKLLKVLKKLVTFRNRNHRIYTMEPSDPKYFRSTKQTNVMENADVIFARTKLDATRIMTILECIATTLFILE